MDCLEFRRRLGSGPQHLNAAAEAHLAACAAGCVEAAAEARAFDVRLTAALAVPVPATLAARITRAQRAAAVADGASPRRTAWLAFAAAASLALAFGIAQWRRNTVPLQALVVAHVTAPEERAAWGLKQPLPVAEVVAVFRDRGVALAGTPPQGVAYVAKCGVGRWPSVHMVMPEQGQPVSVLYVPGHAGTSPVTFHDESLSGRAATVGDGTLYLLARSDARFDALERAWRDAIEGPAQVASGSH